MTAMITAEKWKAPELPADIPGGDMPGDKIKIGKDHVQKAQLIFPLLLKEMEKLKEQDPGRRRYVVSVYGGSGVGKSEVASILGFYLNEAGIGAYIMSGDNYPHRIPEFNDAERERVFEEGSIEALRAYLGSEYEINFKEVNEILRIFHEGADEIFLRRMGRSETELWYEPVSMRDTEVLILEWTHGNNAHLRGVDIPVFLASTPAETLAHRMARGRDGNPDSPFITMVLGLEQSLLASQTHKAKIIVSKAGSIITAGEYLESINAE